MFCKILQVIFGIPAIGLALFLLGAASWSLAAGLYPSRVVGTLALIVTYPVWVFGGIILFAIPVVFVEEVMPKVCHWVDKKMGW